MLPSLCFLSSCPVVLLSLFYSSGVRIQCYGKGKVRWFDSSATGDGADPVYRGQEVYIDKQVYLYESSKDWVMIISPSHLL